MTKAIKEEDGLQKEWYEEAKKQTLETLPAFLKKITEEYEHDYGTICHACAAAAVAAASSVNHAPCGGITGFQAGAVMWEFMRAWNGVEAPAWLLKGENLLYPQYEDDFTGISKDTWKWLQEEAKKRLGKQDKNVHGRIAEHWALIADGRVPFGLRIKAH